ncbi:unnamed protein product, partial [Polarella glacialis]
AVRSRPVRRPLAEPNFAPPPLGLSEDLPVEAVVEAIFALPGAPPAWQPPGPGMGIDVFADWKGGEMSALAYLQRYVWTDDKLKDHVGASNSMQSGEKNAINSTSRLSPWIAFGCISPRKVVYEVRQYEKARGKSKSSYWVYHELIFRDFFRFTVPLWGKTLFSLNGPYDVTKLRWIRDQDLFDRWREGKTGYPFVDAGMRELAATGTISHLHRQCCAAFLVRDLRLDWRLGAEHFEATLLDYTPDANWGNWAYRILPRPQLLNAGFP